MSNEHSAPASYRVVPTVATPKMEQAAEKYWNDRKFSGFSDDPRTWGGVYAAMLAAAPAQPQSDLVPAEEVEVVGYLNTATDEVVKYGPTLMDWDDEQEPVEPLMTVEQHKRLMAATHPADQVAEGVVVPVQLLKIIEQSWRIPSGCPKSVSEEVGEIISNGLAELRALLAKSEGAKP